MVAVRNLWYLIALPSALRLFWGCLILGATLAPLLAAQGRVEAVVFYAAFTPFCHQYADRSWHLLGEPLAVCIRCMGVYGGATLGCILPVRSASRRSLAAASALCGATWILEVTGVLSLPAAVRLGAGAVLGFAASRLVIRGVAQREPARAGLLR